MHVCIYEYTYICNFKKENEAMKLKRKVHGGVWKGGYDIVIIKSQKVKTNKKFWLMTIEPGSMTLS